MRERKTLSLLLQLAFDEGKQNKMKMNEMKKHIELNWNDRLLLSFPLFLHSVRLDTDKSTFVTSL